MGVYCVSTYALYYPNMIKVRTVGSLAENHSYMKRLLFGAWVCLNHRVIQKNPLIISQIPSSLIDV